MDFSLNYVWIQAVRLTVPEDDGLITCPIPKGLMDNVINIAKAYPDMPVSLWVDIYGAGNNTPRILNALNDQNEAPNITFKSLDDIPVYKVDPLFQKLHEDFEHPYDPIWQQVDLARLYVLRHELLREDTCGVIYADMDMVLPDVRSIRFNDITDRYGICFGRFFRSAITECGTFENQFFALSQGFGKAYLMSHLIPYTQDSIMQDLNGWDAIWSVVNEPDIYKALGIESIDDIAVAVTSLVNAENIKQSYQSPKDKLKPTVYALS